MFVGNQLGYRIVLTINQFAPYQHIQKSVIPQLLVACQDIYLKILLLRIIGRGSIELMSINIVTQSILGLGSIKLISINIVTQSIIGRGFIKLIWYEVLYIPYLCKLEEDSQDNIAYIVQIIYKHERYSFSAYLVFVYCSDVSKPRDNSF